MRWIKTFAAAALLLATQVSCSVIGQSAAGPNGELKPALSVITTDDLLRHIKVLASDEFEGRAPGTRGETLTVEYLIKQFKELGLSPGNPDGTYVQRVPMAAITGSPTASIIVGNKTIPLKYPRDYVAVSRQSRQEVAVDSSEMIFVGYGIVAPEYGWDDFKGVDVRGKTLVVLVNDPPVSDPSNPARMDPKVFEGKAMTYYGRWTYKYEIAAKKGAAAVIIVHEKKPAGYPYEVLIRSWGREIYSIEKEGSREDRVPVEGWIQANTARRVFALAGKSFDALKRAAARRDFKPVSIGARACFSIKNTIRKIGSQNVIAKLNGSDPKLKNQCVVFSAHWDHLGKNEKLRGDQIYNGALDNASGTAGLLEIAKAYSRLEIRPPRTIVFLALTAEEEGLLGSEYYAENPLYPLERTSADINMDCLNPWGRTRDIPIIGPGSSFISQIAREVAKSQNRRIVPDLEPEKGFFYRSDQFEFAKRGVPVLYTDAGIDMIGRPSEYGLRKRGQYTRRDYHKVTDEVKSDWDLSGAVEDLQFLFMVGYKIAGEESQR